MTLATPAAIAGTLTGPALHHAKAALRAERVAARDALSAAVRADASARIVERILALPSFAAAPVVLLTWPLRSEWDTRPLIAAALAAGQTVVLPRVDRAARMLRLHSIEEPQRDVLPGFQGISEPGAQRPEVAPGAIAWVLVPGVAFTATGARLGYGGGFYDRLLPLLRPGVPRVAGAFELQVVTRVPIGPHDLTVDTLVTEARTLDCAATPD